MPLTHHDQICASCYGLDHTRQAVDQPGSGRRCVVFTTKSIVRLASLSGADSCLPSATPGVKVKKQWEDAAAAASTALQNWGSQLELPSPSTDTDILHLYYNLEDEDLLLDLLILLSEDDGEDKFFILPAGAANPRSSSYPAG